MSDVRVFDADGSEIDAETLEQVIRLYLHQKKIRTAERWASSLALTPAIMLFPLTIMPFLDPYALIELWDLYLLFFGIPFALATAFWFHARNLRRRTLPEPFPT